MTVSAVLESSSTYDHPLSSSMNSVELGFISETMSAASFLGQLEEISAGAVTGTGMLPYGKNLENKKFKCPNCGRNYIHQKSLRQHMRHECGKEPQFQCPYCPKKSKLKGNMKQHIILVHKGLLNDKQRKQLY